MKICDYTMRRFLELDNRESLPLMLRLHQLHCARCRKELAALQKGFDSLVAVSHAPGENITDRIMAGIKARGVTYSRKVPLFNWVSVELILIASFFMVPFSEVTLWMKQYFGRDLEVPLNIVMGALLCLYSVIFIGTHLDDYKRFRKLMKK